MNPHTLDPATLSKPFSLCGPPYALLSGSARGKTRAASGAEIGFVSGHAFRRATRQGHKRAFRRCESPPTKTDLSSRPTEGTCFSFKRLVIPTEVEGPAFGWRRASALRLDT